MLFRSGLFDTPVTVDPSITKYELTGLRPATSYIVLLKLFNEAGATEQKVRIQTDKEKTSKQNDRSASAMLSLRSLQMMKQ